MDRTDYFVWSVRAQSIASALRSGTVSDELTGRAEALVDVMRPVDTGIFGTAMRPVWYAVLRDRTDLAALLADWRVQPEMFQKLSMRLLYEYERAPRGLGG